MYTTRRIGQPWLGTGRGGTGVRGSSAGLRHGLVEQRCVGHRRGGVVHRCLRFCNVRWGLTSHRGGRRVVSGTGAVVQGNLHSHGAHRGVRLPGEHGRSLAAPARRAGAQRRRNRWCRWAVRGPGGATLRCTPARAARRLRKRSASAGHGRRRRFSSRPRKAETSSNPSGVASTGWIGRCPAF